MPPTSKAVLKAAVIATLTLSHVIYCSTNASAAIGACYDATPNSTGTPKYNGLFAGAVRIPPALLENGWVPQGLALWQNWDGQGNNLLLGTAYDARLGSSRSAMQGINPASGQATTRVFLPESHVGGVAVVGQWIYVSNGEGVIARYSASTVRAALQRPATAPLTLAPLTNHYVYGSSFLGMFGGSLYAGRFDENSSNWMQRLIVEQTSGALVVAESIAVPPKTQGVAVMQSHYIFSTSYGRTNRSNIYVVRRNGYANWSQASGTCMRAPNMAEGITVGAGAVFVTFESGSSVYPDATMRRSTIGVANLARLISELGLPY